jgi:hypothetical protein
MCSQVIVWCYTHSLESGVEIVLIREPEGEKKKRRDNRLF